MEVHFINSAKNKMFQAQLNDLDRKMNLFNPDKKRLRDLDLFVLDNSLRETTVGQLRGHTLENKWAIFEQVKKVGFQNVIVESFNHMTRIGDTFIRQLISRGEDMSKYWAFTEFIESSDNNNRVPNIEQIPIGLIKMKDLGIHNVMMEFDLVYYGIDYKVFTANKLCNLLSQRFKWIRENLSPNSRIFVNIRDFSDCFMKNPRRLFYVVNYLSSLPEDERIFGIAYEEGGKNFPEQLAVWTKCVREEMDRCGWKDGHLIVHVHEQFGMCEATNLDCLANGATGVWAGLSQEGAMMGHASSTLTIMNLIRCGNKKVLRKFNCKHLRTASRKITQIVTTNPPAPMTPVVGERALDVVFGLAPLTSDKKEFNLAEFFGEEEGIRITTLATQPMIVKRLKQLFGRNKWFTVEIAQNMKGIMLADLRDNRKEEYNSMVGLAVLYDRAGGHMTESMSSAIEKAKVKSVHMQGLIDEVREMWNQWDIRDGDQDDHLDFFAFYNGFMAPYFGCYRCDETRKALKCIDMDDDGKVDWNEFCVYLKYAASQYPDTETAEELLGIAFRKGLIPSMQDEMLKELPETSYHDDGNEDEDFYASKRDHEHDDNFFSAE